MSFSTTLTALANTIDPRLAFWSLLLTNGKKWSEHTLLPTLLAGQKGMRQLDWALDIVSTGDIHHICELTLNCPDGRRATLDISQDMPAFQFKTKSLDMMGAGSLGLEYMVVGRVIDKATGRCECFAWDYRPKSGESNLVAYKSSIYKFGGWRDTVTPLGALGVDVQGFKL